jgi:hypothetical protein
MRDEIADPSVADTAIRILEHSLGHLDGLIGRAFLGADGERFVVETLVQDCGDIHAACRGAADAVLRVAVGDLYDIYPPA